MEAVFGKDKIFLEGHQLICWINMFCDHPEKVDIQKMSEISIAVDVAHDQLKPLFSVKRPLLMVLSIRLRPSNSLKLQLCKVANKVTVNWFKSIQTFQN